METPRREAVRKRRRIWLAMKVRARERICRRMRREAPRRARVVVVVVVVVVGSGDGDDVGPGDSVRSAILPIGWCRDC